VQAHWLCDFLDPTDIYAGGADASDTLKYMLCWIYNTKCPSEPSPRKVCCLPHNTWTHTLFKSLFTVDSIERISCLDELIDCGMNVYDMDPQNMADGNVHWKRGPGFTVKRSFNCHVGIVGSILTVLERYGRLELSICKHTYNVLSSIIGTT
jgi:hypothetical protein